MIYLLTIDSDATLVSSTFEITHSSTTSVKEVDLNRGLLQSSASRSASSWILQLVSPGLRCFQQQYHYWLLKLFVLYILTIDSDAALVSNVFEITHSSTRSVKGSRLEPWIVTIECIEICKLVDSAVSLARSTNSLLMGM